MIKTLPEAQRTQGINSYFLKKISWLILVERRKQDFHFGTSLFVPVFYCPEQLNLYVTLSPPSPQWLTLLALSLSRDCPTCRPPCARPPWCRGRPEHQLPAETPAPTLTPASFFLHLLWLYICKWFNWLNVYLIFEKEVGVEDKNNFSGGTALFSGVHYTLYSAHCI